MKLTLVSDEDGRDWHVIERAEHDGSSWLEPLPGVPNAMSFQTSARFSDACVEGTAEEMLEIAQAIQERGSVAFCRCAVEIHGERALFESPRNSLRPGVVTLAEADELAAEIEAKLGSKK